MSSLSVNRELTHAQRLFINSAIVRSVLVHGHRLTVGADLAMC